MSMPRDTESRDLNATTSYLASGGVTVDESCRTIRFDETLVGVAPFGGIGDLERGSVRTSETLASWLTRQQGGLPWRQAVEVVTSVADQLATAHARGDCHGMICPEVIRLTAGGNLELNAWTLDARPAAGPSATQPPKFVGPCQAPEQLRLPQSIKPQSDVYALGVVLYWMLCNRYPFRAAKREDLQREILEDAPQPPRQMAHGVPLELERLCLRLLAKDPSERPANGERLANELRQVIIETESFGLAAELSASSKTVRKNVVVSPDVEQLLVLTWEASLMTSALQSGLRDAIERKQGTVLRQSQFMTIARLAPIDGSPAGLPTLLRHSLAFFAELKLAGSEVAFSVDTAESESLRHRATRLSGRVSARGLELTPRSLEVVRRWLPSHDFSLISSDIGDETYSLVGRASQLAILKARWEQAREGMGQIVLLIGDEGTGKTRLIQELHKSQLETSASVEWICWACRPGLEADRPHPAIEYFQDAGANSDLHLSELELAELTAVQNRDRWQRALVAWLKRIVAVRPVMFVVEDLQWADPATLAFLQTLMDLGLHDRVLTILTCRPEFETPWGSRAHQTQVALSRLTKRHATSLFSSITGVVEPSASVVEELIIASDGIPLFVEGFSRAWQKGASGHKNDSVDLKSQMTVI